VDRQEKAQFVDSLRSDLSDNNIVIIADYAGINVDQVNALRGSARENGSTVRVVKNSLFKIAAKDTNHSKLAEDISGPSLLVMSKEPVSAAKMIVDFVKDNESLEIKLGSYENSVIANEEVINLSKMPSLEELRAKLIALISTPASNIVGLLKAPARDVAGVIHSYANKQG
jgi:large subunit ribosomal protein L10